jgi:hypothetical protein
MTLARPFPVEGRENDVRLRVGGVCAAREETGGQK